MAAKSAVEHANFEKQERNYFGELLPDFHKPYHTFARMTPHNEEPSAVTIKSVDGIMRGAHSDNWSDWKTAHHDSEEKSETIVQEYSNYRHNVFSPSATRPCVSDAEKPKVRLLYVFRLKKKMALNKVPGVL